VLLAIPDERQNERMHTVMNTVKRVQPYAESGIGLLVAARELSLSRTPPHYSTDLHFPSAVDRYIEIAKILYQVTTVADWMGHHRDLWSWMEQRRGERERGRDVAAAPRHHPAAVNHHQYSDSDINQGIGNESDGEDEDYRYDQVETLPNMVRCDKIEVSGAGLEAINGMYEKVGTVDGVGKYTKVVNVEGRNELLSLYRCQLHDNTRKWFISIVPTGQLPGTTKDIDYYWAPCSNDVKGTLLPPEQGWEFIKENGKLPNPTLRVHIIEEDEVNASGQSDVMWNEEDDEVESGRDVM